jgi:hypothetical protein
MERLKMNILRELYSIVRFLAVNASRLVTFAFVGGLICLSSCCARAQPNLVCLEPPLVIPPAQTTNYVQCDIPIGTLRLARHPEAWEVSEMKPPPYQAKGVLSWLKISHDGLTAPVVFAVIPGILDGGLERPPHPALMTCPHFLYQVQ